MNRSMIRLFDPVSGTFRPQEVTCGYCAVCRQNKQNDWFTRMAKHSEDYKYVYFVTFTYASPETADTVGCNWVRYYNRLGMPQTKRLQVGKLYQTALYDMHKRVGTVFSRNASNTKHELKELPAAVPQKAMQNMWKKLRSLMDQAYKDVDHELTYYSCYEYGHTFGHCHHHAIVWSKVPIGYGTFQNAWSRKYVEVDGEVVPYRGQKKNAGKPFLTSFGHVDYVDLVANGSMANGGKDANGKHVFGYVCKYLQKQEFNDLQLRDGFNRLPDCLGVELMFGESEQFFPSKRTTKIYNNEVYDYRNFKKLFKPYTRCSTRNAIGLRYAISRLNDFEKGNFAISASSGDDPLTMPSYFVSQTKQSILPFRTPYSVLGSRTNALGNLKINLHNLEILAILNSSTSRRFHSCKAAWKAAKRAGLWSNSRADTIRQLTFYDKTNKFYYTLKFCHGKIVYSISSYQRGVGYLERDQVFIEQFLSVYKECVERYSKFMDIFHKAAREREYFLEAFKSRLKANAIDWADLKYECEKRNLERIHGNQRLYHALHEREYNS